ncbi:MAG: hypothetical protein IT257_01430 [Chitinophagaceae bacterium]|nr:hypothetical protein [Chitinophagaceae bacterium]
MEINQNPQEGHTPNPTTGNEHNNEQQKQEITPNNDQDNSKQNDQQGDGDKFRKHESEDDHRDIPEIGEDEKEIERNTPRM